MTSFVHGHGPSRDQFPSSLGAQLSATSLSVTIATDSSLPITITSAANDPIYTRLTNGTTAYDTVTSAQLPDSLGIKAAAASLSVVLASDGVLPLPTGAATSAKQDTGNTSLGAIDTKLGGTLAVSAVSLPLPTGAATQTTLAAIDTKLGGTIAVSAASLPLPTGAATQTTLAAIDTKLGSALTVNLPTGAATETTLAAASAKLPATLGQKLSAASMSVVIAGDQSAVPASQSGTWTITGLSGTVSLPTGASTSALQGTGNTSLASIDTKLVQHALDSGASSGAIRTVLSTRQEAAATPISVRLSDGSAFYEPDRKGRSYADSARNDYTSVSVTTGAWVQLIASTAADINLLYLFDSSGQTLELGTGAAASEARKLIIPPGGLPDGVPLRIASGTRVSVRAVSATASVGEIDLVGLS